MLEGRSTDRAERSETLLDARLEPLPPAFRSIDFRLDCFLATASPPRHMRGKANRRSTANPVVAASRGDQTSRSIRAFRAQITVLADISTAPTAGLRTMPHCASTPAAAGIATTL